MNDKVISVEEAAQLTHCYFKDMSIRSDFIPFVLEMITDMPAGFERKVLQKFGFAPDEDVWIMCFREKPGKGKMIYMVVDADCSDGTVKGVETAVLEKLDYKVVWFSK